MVSPADGATGFGEALLESRSRASALLHWGQFGLRRWLRLLPGDAEVLFQHTRQRSRITPLQGRDDRVEVRHRLRPLFLAPGSAAGGNETRAVQACVQRVVQALQDGVAARLCNAQMNLLLELETLDRIPPPKGLHPAIIPIANG